MAGNRSNTSIFRRATRFKQVLITAFRHKGDATDQGDRPDLVPLTIRAATGQTGNLLELQDKDGAVLASFSATALQSASLSAALTAFATGGQAGAIAMPSTINRLSVAAAQGDSAKLPAALAGTYVFVENRGAKPAQIFGSGTDTINGIATATGISQGVNTLAMYICSVAGNWEVPLNMLSTTFPSPLTTNGAVPAHSSHTYAITKAGVFAGTLAAPTAGTDDGLQITITSDTANAHTITATGLLQTGSAAVDVATFAAFAGAGLTLLAYNGKWKVVSSVGVTFS